MRLFLSSFFGGLAFIVLCVVSYNVWYAYRYPRTIEMQNRKEPVPTYFHPNPDPVIRH